MILKIKYNRDYLFDVEDDKTSHMDLYSRTRELGIKEIENEYIDELKELGILRDIRIFLRNLKISKLMNKVINDDKYKDKVIYDYWGNFTVGISGISGHYNTCIGYTAGLNNTNIGYRLNSTSIGYGLNNTLVGYPTGSNPTVVNSSTTLSYNSSIYSLNTTLI